MEPSAARPRPDVTTAGEGAGPNAPMQTEHAEAAPAATGDTALEPAEFQDVLRAVGERMDGLLEVRTVVGAGERAADEHEPGDAHASVPHAADGPAAGAGHGIATELISIEAPSYGVASFPRRPAARSEHAPSPETDPAGHFDRSPQGTPPALSDRAETREEPRAPEVRDSAQVSRARRVDDGLGSLRSRLVQRRAVSAAPARRRIFPRRSQVVEVLGQVATGLVLVAVSAAISIFLV